MATYATSNPIPATISTSFPKHAGKWLAKYVPKCLSTLWSFHKPCIFPCCSVCAYGSMDSTGAAAAAAVAVTISAREPRPWKINILYFYV